MDDATSGMDPIAIRDFRDLVIRLAKNGHTIFLSTHTMELAEKLCDRVAIIHKGKLAGIGSASTLRVDMIKKDASLEDIFIELTQQGSEKTQS